MRVTRRPSAPRRALRVSATLAVTLVAAALLTPSAHAQSRSVARPLLLPPEVQTHIPVDSAAALSDVNPAGMAMLYAVRVPSLGELTVKAYDRDGTIYVPLGTLMRFFGMPYAVDTVSHVLTMDGRDVRFSAATLVTVDRVPYVALNPFAEALAIRPIVDYEDAAIAFDDAGALPSVRRVARARAREALRRAEIEAEYQQTDGSTAVVPNTMSSWGGLSLDYAAVAQRAAGLSTASYSLDAATGVAGGSLIARSYGVNEHVQGELSWRRVWQTGEDVAQLRIGQGVSSGLGSVGSRGVFVTNAPYTRPMLLSMLPLSGALPSEWSVEVYRDGMFLGFDSVGTGGQYSVPVPLQYGENPFTVLVYGPSGETRQFTRVVRALPDMLPVHRFEYAGSAGPCVSSACMWTLNADFRYGLTPFWTLRGGATEYGWHDASADVHPYAAVQGRPLDPLGFGVEIMHRVYRRASFTLDPWIGTSFFGELTQYASTRSGESIGGTRGRRQLFVAGRVTPFGFPAIDAQVFRTSNSLGVVSFVRFASTLALPNATVRPYARRESAYGVGETFGGVEVTAIPPFGTLARAPMWVRAGLEAGTNGWSRAEATVARQIWSRRTQMEAGLRWQRTFPGARLVLGVSTNLDAMRLSTSAISASRGADAGGVIQRASGALRWDGVTDRFMPSPDPVLDRAGVAGTVFLDDNENGVLDPGERVLKGVQVRVNGIATTTDANGRYAVWGVTVMDGIPVSVDTTTLESPWWTPRFNQLIVHASPDRAAEVPVAIVAGGILEGQVRVRDGTSGARVPLIAVNVETGARRVVSVFDDGTFYAMGILPGTYLLQVDDRTLDVLNVDAPPVSVQITSTRTTSGVRFTLVPRDGRQLVHQ